MGEHYAIISPSGEDDQEGARRVFEQFLIIYQPTLTRLEQHLEGLIETTEPAFAQAYEPWHKALQDLFRGVYMVAKKVPLPDPEAFIDALRMFTFESAIQFLNDLCISCKMVLHQDWVKTFREHIN